MKATGPASRSASRRSSRRSIRATSAARAELVRKVIPDAVITCSSDLGRIGLLERENAALLNAALADLARETIAALREGDRRFAASPRRCSSPRTTAPSPRRPGAAPAGLQLRLGRHQLDARRGLSRPASTDAMVIDVGGTTTDVGQLKHGFPREANSVVKVGGVRTLFRMPDLLSIGLGGGSHVQLDPLKVGPVSVGYRLLKEGIAFGGTAAHHDRHRRRRRACSSSATARRSRISTRRPARRCSPRPRAWPRRRSTA